MKTTILLITLLLLTACNGGGSGSSKTGAVETFEIDPIITSHNWVRLVQVNPGDDDYEAFIISENGISKINYQKATAGGSPTSVQEQFDSSVVLTANNAAVITNQADNTDVNGITFDLQPDGRLSVCLNGTCHLYDQYAANDL